MDAWPVASSVRTTGSKFRLLRWLFVQIGHILKVNNLAMITITSSDYDNVIAAARSILMAGLTSH